MKIIAFASLLLASLAAHPPRPSPKEIPMQRTPKLPRKPFSKLPPRALNKILAKGAKSSDEMARKMRALGPTAQDMMLVLR
jgi:hypothetical protein